MVKNRKERRLGLETMSFIKLENVSQIFGFGDATTVALDQVSLEIKKGEFVAVMGPSGAGKTSLLSIIGLITPPAKGLYSFLDQETVQLSQSRLAKIRQQKIGFVFQKHNLLPNLTILDNVSLPLLYSTNTGFLKRVEIVKKLLGRLGIHRKEFLYPYQLSGGQIQRAAIARSLINQPTMLIADEPTGNLDSANRRIVMELLQGVNEDGLTIVIATHDPELTKYANRILYIQDGRIRVDQKLRKNQQIDLGKIKDAIKKQDMRQKNKQRSAGEKDAGQETKGGSLRKAKVRKIRSKK